VRLIRAPSCKLQALKLQAASIKPQAASIKLQAASDKLPNLQAFIKFQATSIRGLDADESIDVDVSRETLFGVVRILLFYSYLL
jgi:hypothetical protein